MDNRRSALPGQIVYLAGPMSGLPFEECRKWRDKACNFLSKLRDARSGDHLYHILNPLRGYSGSVYCAPCNDDISAERADIRRDRYDISRSDVILADLTDSMLLANYIMDDLESKIDFDDPIGVVSSFLDEHVKPLLSRASIGTVCELDQAHLESKFIIVVMTEDNPHWHSFLKDMAAVIVETLDEALDYMKNTLNTALVE